MSEPIDISIAKLDARRRIAWWDAAGQELLGFVRQTLIWAAVCWIAGPLPLGWLLAAAALTFGLGVICYFVSVAYAGVAHRLDKENPDGR